MLFPLVQLRRRRHQEGPTDREVPAQRSGERPPRRREETIWWGHGALWAYSAAGHICIRAEERVPGLG